MDILSRVAQAMQTVLTSIADSIASETGFVQRLRKLSGSKFAQTLIFGWLSNPSATLEELAQTAATLGVKITPQAIDKRFTQKASEYLKRILESTVGIVITVSPQAIPIMQRFNGVYIQDSSTIVLPDELEDVWQGCGGSSSKNTSSSVKIQVRWDYKSGTLIGPYLQPGREHDRNSCLQTESLPKGSMRIADLGYFSLQELAEMNSEGKYWLTRVKSQCILYDEEGNKSDLVEFLNADNCDEISKPILLGAKEKVPCRLIAVRMSEQVANKRRRKIWQYARGKGRTPSKRQLTLANWTILATNAEEEKVSLKEALVLARVRWQIELLFKLWKNEGNIDSWRSKKPWRILCEFYAKLITMVIQHWILLTSCWEYENRSLTKASRTIRSHAMNLAVAFAKGSIECLVSALEVIKRCLSFGCKIYKRKSQPNTYQILMDATF